MDSRSKHQPPSLQPDTARHQSCPAAVALSWAYPCSAPIAISPKQSSPDIPLPHSSEAPQHQAKESRRKKEFSQTHVQHKYAEPRLGPTSHVPSCSLDILLQLPDRILQRGSRVVHLVHNEYVFADEIRHFERGQIQPLRARDLGAWRFHRLGGIARRE